MDAKMRFKTNGTANKQKAPVHKIHDRKHSVSLFIEVPQNYANLGDASTATAAFNHVLH